MTTVTCPHCGTEDTLPEGTFLGEVRCEHCLYWFDGRPQPAAGPATEPVVGECQCEHNAHSSELAVPPSGHPMHRYGARCEVTPVRTTYGTFNLCAHCATVCMAGYLVVDGVSVRRTIVPDDIVGTR